MEFGAKSANSKLLNLGTPKYYGPMEAKSGFWSQNEYNNDNNDNDGGKVFLKVFL